jgi:predicted DNA-binding transcriptional regulator AlpA
MTDQPKSPMRLLGMKELKARWGCSNMFIERRLRSDPDFPKPLRFTRSKIRKFVQAEVEAYEQIAMNRGMSREVSRGMSRVREAQE